MTVLLSVDEHSRLLCCLLSITLCNYLTICFLPSSIFFLNIEEFGAKNFFTDHRTTIIIHYNIETNGPRCNMIPWTGFWRRSYQIKLLKFYQNP